LDLRPVKKFRYTKKHLDFLRTGYLSMNIRDLTKAFNKRFKIKKTENQIKSALANHKIICGRKHGERLITPRRLCTPAQDEFIRIEYLKHSVKELTAILNNKFGTEFTEQQIKTYVKNNKIQSGRTGCFEKGHRNWNKGTKGLCKPNSGSFKKGRVPANHKKLGSERTDKKDGYVWIKVAEWDPNFHRPTRWKCKHVHLWEQKYGPVPEGFVLKFIDGDKENVDPSNLMLISLSLNLRLNKHGYNNAPAEIKPSILALAKMEVKMFEAENRAV